LTIYTLSLLLTEDIKKRGTIKIAASKEKNKTCSRKGYLTVYRNCKKATKLPS